MNTLYKTGIISLMIMVMPVMCWSVTYYLDAVNGDDSNPGTSDAPWKRLSKAQSAATDGDVIHLMSGNYGSYTESKVSRSDWITYKAADGEEPQFDKIWLNGWDSDHTIYESYLKFDGIIIDSSVGEHGVHILEASNLIFQNMKIIGKGYMYHAFHPNSDNTAGMFFSSSYNVEIDNCRIYGNGNSLIESWPGIQPITTTADPSLYGQGFNWGIHLTGANVGGNFIIKNCDIAQSEYGIQLFKPINSTIENNHIHHITGDGINFGAGCENSINEQTVVANNHIHDIFSFATLEGYIVGSHNDGVQFQGTNPEWVNYTNMVLRNNRVHDIAHQGFWLRVGGGSENWLIENNLIYNVPAGTDLSSTIRIISARDIVFRNNTIDGDVIVTPEWNVTKVTSFTGNIIKRLDIYTDSGVILEYENYNIINRKWIHMTGHELGDNSMVLNDDDRFQALFNDYGNADYTLASDSIAINLSMPANAPSEDILGNLRDANPDAGCYEYGASPPEGKYTLRVNTIGSGTVVKTPNKFLYDENDTVSIRAYPDEGFIFESWSGDAAGSQNPTTVTMDSNKSITAQFNLEFNPLAEEITETKLRMYNNILKSGQVNNLTIWVDVKETSHVSVILYDNKGKKIKTFINEEKEADRYPVVWDGSDELGNAVGSGIYMLHVKCGSYSETKKIAVVK